MPLALPFPSAMGAKAKTNKDRNAARNARKKQAKAEKEEPASAVVAAAPSSSSTTTSSSEVDVVYVAAELDMGGMEEFKDLVAAQAALAPTLEEAVPEAAAVNSDSDSDSDEEFTVTKKGPSRREQKAMRLSIAELKQAVADPSLVESHDVASADPLLLLHLKAVKSAVPVPSHWAQKRKYLQGKRGVEKAAFTLPKFIEDTGIGEVRGASQEDESKMSAKQKGRSRVAPKMGKIDVDYKTLHDAFFKYQSKPSMSTFGELYYEGKEFEQDVSVYKPGIISDELKAALGMPDGAPPPWLVNMQRYGPPPSYPNLKIPGLTAPLPSGASFGFHPGGWGKPPLDAYGRPLYGDVFGGDKGEEPDFVYAGDGTVVGKKPWGARPERDADESDSESDDDDDDDDDDEAEGEEGEDSGEVPADGADSVASSLADGYNSVATKDLKLRKEEDESTVGGGETPQLYTVLQTKARKAADGSDIFGSDVQYVLPGGGGADSTLSGAESIISKAANSDKRKRNDDSDSDDDDDGEGGDAKKFKF